MQKKQTKVVNSINEVDMSDLKLPQIAVYYHPDDYPEDCVARVFDNGQPTNVIMVRQTVPELDCDIQKHTNMAFFSRGAEDAKSVVGVWM